MLHQNEQNMMGFFLDITGTRIRSMYITASYSNADKTKGGILKTIKL